MDQKNVKDKDKDGIMLDSNIEKDIYVWVQMERPFKKRNREFWLTAIAILILVSVLFVYMKEFLLIMSLFSALFYFMLCLQSSHIELNIA